MRKLEIWNNHDAYRNNSKYE